MSVFLYDDAIVQKLRTLTEKSHIYIVPPSLQFRTIAKLQEDTVEMPFISLQRTGWGLKSERPHSMKFHGLKAVVDEEAKTTSYLQAIPIRINYLMDIWSKTREENDMILRELLFYFSINPTLEVTIPYGINQNHVFNLFFDNEVEDNSDIVEQLNHGEYFRQTISLYTDDAYLWKSRVLKPYVLELSLDINDGAETTEVGDFDVSGIEPDE